MAGMLKKSTDNSYLRQTFQEQTRLLSFDFQLQGGTVGTFSFPLGKGIAQRVPIIPYLHRILFYLWPELLDVTDFTTTYCDHIVSNWQNLDLFSVN